MKKEYDIVMHETNQNIQVTYENSFTSLLTLNTILLNEIEPDWMKRSGFKSQIEIKNNHKVESHMDSYSDLVSFVRMLPSGIREAAEKKRYLKKEIR